MHLFLCPESGRFLLPDWVLSFLARAERSPGEPRVASSKRTSKVCHMTNCLSTKMPFGAAGAWFLSMLNLRMRPKLLMERSKHVELKASMPPGTDRGVG